MPNEKMKNEKCVFENKHFSFFIFISQRSGFGMRHHGKFMETTRSQVAERKNFGFLEVVLTMGSTTTWGENFEQVFGLLGVLFELLIVCSQELIMLIWLRTIGVFLSLSYSQLKKWLFRVDELYRWCPCGIYSLFEIIFYL